MINNTHNTQDNFLKRLQFAFGCTFLDSVSYISLCEFVVFLVNELRCYFSYVDLLDLGFTSHLGCRMTPLTAKYIPWHHVVQICSSSIEQGLDLSYGSSCCSDKNTSYWNTVEESLHCKLQTHKSHIVIKPNYTLYKNSVQKMVSI